jgi:hypothetical protein
MSGDNGAGVYRQIQDELFLSQQCLRDEVGGPDGKNKGASLYPNPHDGRVENERYCFHFPATWYYSHAVNKAIGLRKISFPPRWYNFEFGFNIADITKPTEIFEITNEITISPDMDMCQIADALESCINGAIEYRFTNPNELDSWVYVKVNYDNDLRMVKFIFYPRNIDLFEINDFIITLWNNGSEHDNEQFFDLMNVPVRERAALLDQSNPNFFFAFQNVWNRKPEELYFHASFVNHTQFNYLGIAGDFYTKPSKIFTADNLPMDFYFWLTTDIMRPIVLPFERFIIELAFIIDTQDYQSP